MGIHVCGAFVVGVNVGRVGLAEIGCEVGPGEGALFVMTLCEDREGAPVGVPDGTRAVPEVVEGTARLGFEVLGLWVRGLRV